MSLYPRCDTGINTWRRRGERRDWQRRGGCCCRRWGAYQQPIGERWGRRGRSRGWQRRYRNLLNSHCRRRRRGRLIDVCAWRILSITRLRCLDFTRRRDTSILRNTVRPGSIDIRNLLALTLPLLRQSPHSSFDITRPYFTFHIRWGILIQPQDNRYNLLMR